MKYQAEREAVELGLLDIGDLVAENIDRLDFAQQQDIQHRVELIRLLLKRKLPLKAKQQLKYLDKYIQQSLYDYDYCPSLYLDW